MGWETWQIIVASCFGLLFVMLVIAAIARSKNGGSVIGAFFEIIGEGFVALLHVLD